MPTKLTQHAWETWGAASPFCLFCVCPLSAVLWAEMWQTGEAECVATVCAENARSMAALFASGANKMLHIKRRAIACLERMGEHHTREAGLGWMSCDVTASFGCR